MRYDESGFRDRGTKRNDDGTGNLYKKVDKKEVVIVEYSKKSSSRKVAAMMCRVCKFVVYSS